jgi:hypothetical protein
MHDPEYLTAVKMKMLVFWVVTVNLQVDTGVSDKLTASILSPEVRTTSQARTTPFVITAVRTSNVSRCVRWFRFTHLQATAVLTHITIVLIPVTYFSVYFELENDLLLLL